MNETVLKSFINNKEDIDCALNTAIKELKSNILSEDDENLLKLCFSPNPTQEELNNFLKDWDIEVKGGHKALMLSYFMKMHPNLTFPEYVAPRLKGLLKFYKFQNMDLISHFVKITREIINANIPVLILKGGAMKYFRPELSRVMSDIDILVPEKNYEEAGKIVEKLGYAASYGEHSVDIHKKDSIAGLMDIHKFICMNTGHERNINEDFFKRANLCNVFGLNVLVPSKEDMLFIALVNMVRNLSENTSSSGILYNLFDCNYLINSTPDFNWNIVKENAIKTKTEEQVYLAIQFLNNIVPDLIPDKLDFLGGFKEKIKDYYSLFVFQRFYLYPMKMRGHELTISKAIKDKKLFREYLRLKPKYLILKQKLIKNNPNIARFAIKNIKVNYGQPQN